MIQKICQGFGNIFLQILQQNHRKKSILKKYLGQTDYKTKTKTSLFLFLLFNFKVYSILIKP